LTPDGIIMTVVGNGTTGFGGDGGPGVDAALNYPKVMVIDGSGNLFFADVFNSRIRMMTADGVISTIAGTGRIGFRGDGGPAENAQFRFPNSVALAANGRLYVADSQNNRIRLLTPVDQQSSNALPSIETVRVFGGAIAGGLSSASVGGWLEIYGSNLAAASRPWSAADFDGMNPPTSLEGTKVTIGGRAAALAYVSPTQVNAQVPSGVGNGTRQVTVTSAAGSSAPVEIAVN
jgi:hypothetical protein